MSNVVEQSISVHTLCSFEMALCEWASPKSRRIRRLLLYQTNPNSTTELPHITALKDISCASRRSSATRTSEPVETHQNPTSNPISTISLQPSRIVITAPTPGTIASPVRVPPRPSANICDHSPRRSPWRSRVCGSSPAHVPRPNEPVRPSRQMPPNPACQMINVHRRPRRTFGFIDGSPHSRYRDGSVSCGARVRSGQYRSRNGLRETFSFHSAICGVPIREESI